MPVAANGQTLRLDRLVALQGPGDTLQWWVLDYKLQHHPAEVQDYREQLRSYVAAVQLLQPGSEVHGAFITGRGEVVALV